MFCIEWQGLVHRHQRQKNNRKGSSCNNGYHISFPDAQIETGAVCLVHGASGSGKSTLLGLLAGTLLLQNSSGEIRGPVHRPHQHQHPIGTLPQYPHLLQMLTVLENLNLVYFANKIKQTEATTQYAMLLLAQLQLADMAYCLPKQLSQGQAQRVALACALLLQPQLLLADEPTSHLDDDSALNVANLLVEQTKLVKTTLVIATHDVRLLPFATQTIELLP